MEDLDNNRSIPLLRGPANMMMLGPNGANLASAAVRIHPVDRMQRGKSGEFIFVCHWYFTWIVFFSFHVFTLPLLILHLCTTTTVTPSL